MKWLCQSAQITANRKRKIHNKDHSSDNQSSDKKIKKSKFSRRSTKLSTTDGSFARSMTNITPILETYGQQ